MPDLVVTIPRESWGTWVAGDASAATLGAELEFACGKKRPSIKLGDRLYFVSHDRLRAFATVTKIVAACWNDEGEWILGWTGLRPTSIGAQFSQPARPEHTDLAYVRGFHGVLERWWSREDEVGFPDWHHRDLWLNRADGRKVQPVVGHGPQGGLFDG